MPPYTLSTGPVELRSFTGFYREFKTLKDAFVLIKHVPYRYFTDLPFVVQRNYAGGEHEAMNWWLYRNHPEIGTQTAFIIFDDLGLRIPADILIRLLHSFVNSDLAYLKTPQQRHRMSTSYQHDRDFRNGPVPRQYMHNKRRIRSAYNRSEVRQNLRIAQDNEELDTNELRICVRPCRSKLPNLWDLEARRRRKRSWKDHRKTQWKAD